MSGYVCEHCRALALRSAHAALDVLGDGDATKATRQIAVEELVRGLELLHRASALRADEDAD